MFYTNHKGIDVVMERFVVSAINRLQVRGTNSPFCYRKKLYSPIVEVLKVSTAYQEIINQTYLSGILIKKITTTKFRNTLNYKKYTYS